MVETIPVVDEMELRYATSLEHSLNATTVDAPLMVCYEDEALLVVDKPSGVLSQPGKQFDGSILTQVRGARPEATGPLLVHRLDMDTSGLLLLAKRRDVHRALQQQFEKREVFKRYEALLSGSPAGLGGRIDLPLRLDLEDRPRQIVCFEHGKAAQTAWWRCDTLASQVARVRLAPTTGRTHQLRVHASSVQGLDAPILGDRLYGVPDERLFLHAAELGFEHPIERRWLHVRSTVPF